jgi:uncharacterized RDD family membrane protein YckC
MSYGQPQSQGYSGRGTGPRAGFWVRFGAALTDGIILGLIDVILRAAFKTAGSFIGIAIAIVYYVVLEGGPRGQTMGKQMMRIRVVDADTGGPIGYPRAFVRYVGRILSFIVILLGYFWMLWDKERQCWHDKLAGDFVVPLSAYPLP